MYPINTLYRYPVKGLSAEPMERVTLSPGEGLPGDREYALARNDAPFDASRPEPLPKTNFLMLMRHETLAALRTRFDPGRKVLSITDAGGGIAEGCLTDAKDRTRLEDFFFDYMDGAIDAPPRLVQAPGHMFSDRAERLVSLINLKSIGEFSDRLGRAVDPLRFRANIYFSGDQAWQEFNWLDRPIRIGVVELLVIDRIQRCAATNVDPASAKRDMNIPQSLQRHYGHPDMGIYARVVRGGEISAKDVIELI